MKELAEQIKKLARSVESLSELLRMLIDLFSR